MAAGVIIASQISATEETSCMGYDRIPVLPAGDIQARRCWHLSDKVFY